MRTPNPYYRPYMEYWIMEGLHISEAITRARAVRFLRTARGKAYHFRGATQTWKLPCGLTLCVNRLPSRGPEFHTRIEI